MSGIKYYRLAKGEEMPDEFCVVRDVDGEPSEYLFYVPETENAKLRAARDTWAENDAKLRELVRDMFAFLDGADCARFPAGDVVITQAQVGNFYDRMAQLGMEVDG